MKAERAKQIWKVSDYHEIKAHYLNRKIKRPHIKTLKEQIKLKDLGADVPIVLNQENIIIDGHHRFVARKELGLPIFFVNDHNLEEKDIIMLNVNRSDWTTNEQEISLSVFIKKQKMNNIKTILDGEFFMILMLRTISYLQQ